MEIQVGVLKRNIGISYSFILAQLERRRDEWFGNASTSWEIGGCAGGYFMLENQKYGCFLTYWQTVIIKKTRDPLPKITNRIP